MINIKHSNKEHVFVCLFVCFEGQSYFIYLAYFLNRNDIKAILFTCYRLLDVLAARKDPRGLLGLVLIDGQPQPADFKLASGYVVQVGLILIVSQLSCKSWKKNNR